MKRTLIIDNYDSFTYNLFHAVAELGGSPVVFHNDKTSLKEIINLAPTHIIISPGPGTPANASDVGISREAIKAVVDHRSSLHGIPLLGVCLGHQAIAHHFGARIVHAPQPMHGKTSEVNPRPDQSLSQKWLHPSLTVPTLFHNLPKTFTAMRYHSLIIDTDSLPSELIITGTTADSPHLIMAIQHRTLPIFGVQFHPESIGTPSGLTMLRNFLETDHVRSDTAGEPS